MLPSTALFSAALRRILHRRSSPRHRRSFHSSIEYPLTHPIYTIWASNTSLGKTLVSAGLSISFISSSSSSPIPKKKFIYLKPIQTGFPGDSDSRFVYSKLSEFLGHKPLPFSVFASNHFLKASIPAAGGVLGSGIGGGSVENEYSEVDRGFGGGFVNVRWYEERKLTGNESTESELPVSEVVCKTLYGWKEAVSPHLAAEREGAMVGDSELLDMLKRSLGNGAEGMCGNREESEVMCVIETAGGVASPGPSGTLQCDLYRCVFF